jgi:hypothetical protein
MARGFGSFRKAVFAAFMALFVCAPSFAQAPPPISPDAPKWDALGKIKVSIDKQGAYVGAYHANIAAMHGKPYQITGYMVPLDEQPATNHFLLTRYPLTCPYCDPYDPTQSVEVFVKSPIIVSFNALTVSGDFTLNKNSAEGLFYQMDVEKAGVKMLHAPK